MSVSYMKLWHLLLDKGLNKKELAAKAGISAATLSKMSKSQTVNGDILVRICKVLNCDISDIMEVIHEEQQ